MSYAVASADGRITTSPDVILLHGDERWEKVAGTGYILPELVNLYNPHATLEGSGSFMKDKDSLEPIPRIKAGTTNLHEDYLPDSIIDELDLFGWFIIIDSRGRVRWKYKEGTPLGMKGWFLMVLTSRSTPKKYLAYLRKENIPYLVAGDNRVDLTEAMVKMKKN